MRTVARIAAAAGAVWFITGAPVAQAIGAGKELQSLAIEAIDSPSGIAHGIINGPAAAEVARATGSKAPVRVDVSTIKAYPQPGCKRLAFRISQANVMTKQGVPTTFRSGFELNICRDGSPLRGADDAPQ